MTIQGVKGIETNTLKSYRIHLDRMKTNGHDFCELIVDEKHKNFTARLYGGEVYSYGWEAPGENFIDFLIQTFEERSGYLYIKLANLLREEFVDMGETKEKMKALIVEKRENGSIDDELAIEVLEEIEELANEDQITFDHFYDIYHNTMSSELRTEVLEVEPWEGDYVISQKDEDVLVFCEKVAPILADVLKAEGQKMLLPS